MIDDGAERQATMQRDILLVAAAGLSLINGQAFSPLFDPVFFMLRPFVAATFYKMPLVAFYVTSILISAMTLILAGIPAAIYERARGLKESTPASIGIWFVCTLLLTFPALKAAMGFAD